MTAFWITIGVLCATTALTKGLGPVVLGGRALPERFTGVIALMAPALLTALVVTSVLADGDHWAAGAVTIGIAVAGVAAWRGASVVTTMVIAVVVTALLRQVGVA